MIEEKGRVVAIDAEGVWVETVRQGACASCAARNGCGQKLLVGAGQGKRFIFRVNHPENVQVQQDDTVLLGIEEGAFLKATLFMYLVPIVSLLAGALLANSLFASEPVIITVALLSLLLSFLFIRYGSRSIFSSCRYQPTVMQVI